MPRSSWTRFIAAERDVIETSASSLSAQTPTSTMNFSSAAIASCGTTGLPASVPNTIGTPARAARTSPSYCDVSAIERLRSSTFHSGTPHSSPLSACSTTGEKVVQM